VLTCLPKTEFTVRRFEPTTTTIYGTESGDYEDFYAYGTLSAAKPSHINRLEEGKRKSKAYLFITEDTLIGAETGGQVPDWVQVGSEWFEVFNLESWNNDVMVHNEYLIVKIENPPDYL